MILEDFLTAGPHHQKLELLRADYPIVFHSVGLNIAGTDPFDLNLLQRYKDIYARFEPEWVSDHLCWSSNKGVYHHDLLPFPKTEEALKHVTKRVLFLQEFFEQTIVIENITSYLQLSDSIAEPSFLNKLVAATDCELLLDISNVLINAANHHFDPSEFFEPLNMRAVRQIHLSGGAFDGVRMIDSHSSTVNELDIEVTRHLLRKHGPIPVLLERDDNIPSFQSLHDEMETISRKINRHHH